MADMMTGLKPLLELMSDGAVHSGEALGEALGISRAAVWKQLQKLEKLGLDVVAVRGSGYRLSAPLDLLDEVALCEQLSSTGLGAVELNLSSVVGSTNQEALDWAESAPFGSTYAVLAEQQLAGRGRRGRTWISPYAANLYLSLVASFSGGAAALEGLSLAVGVAVRRALLRFNCSAQLKWPNDILCDGKKLGGILLEMTGDPVGDCRVVIGIGLNIAMPSSAAEAIDQPWTDLAAQLPELPSRTELAAALIEEVVNVTANYQNEGFKAWREEWLEACAYNGQQVVLRGPGQESNGVMVGVDETGALLLQSNEGQVERIIGGEVSLRGARQGDGDE